MKPKPGQTRPRLPGFALPGALLPSLGKYLRGNYGTIMCVLYSALPRPYNTARTENPAGGQFKYYPWRKQQ